METLDPALSSLITRPPEQRRIGPFVLVEQLGAGGYAPVWLARETYGKAELRTAAVKLFSLDVNANDRSRILEEARALCRVEHPNVVRFYALAVDEAAGVMGLAMEHVAGRSLEDRIEAEGKLSVDETLRVGVAIASALAAVHGAGLVHRDVKPSNIVEEAGGAYKLIDFGIASASSTPAAVEDVIPAGPDSGMTPRALAATARISGRITGTYGYIDPAVFGAGAPPSAASDLYALGVTLHRCLSGALPAERIGDEGALDPGVLTGYTRPLPLAARIEGVPRALAALIDHLLSPRPEDRPPRASWVAHHFEQIRRDLAGRARVLPDEDEGPFRGLRRFEARDRDVFFGRTPEVAAAIELCRGRGLVALVGPSGSGKSSLARAGILPALAEGGIVGWPEVWDTAIAEPGRDPRAAIAAALAPFLPNAATLAPGPLCEAMARRASEEERGIVLFVDQLEELVTTSSGESREEAAALLVRIGTQPLPGVRAIVAARSDLLHLLLAMGDLGNTMARGLCRVEPLSPTYWRDSVERALASYGYALEDAALAEELFAGIDATAGAMPLVEFALTELWNARDKGKKLLLRSALTAVGGVEGALERHAEAVLASMEQAEEGSIEAARAVLLALTTAEGTRRVMSVDELAAIAGTRARRVIEALGEARLVVPAEGPGASVTLAHEALLSRWGRLASWIAEAKGDRMLAEEIEHDAARFARDAESATLWRGRRLEFAKELQRTNTVRLSAAAERFIQASVRVSRRGRVLAATAGAIVAASIVVGGLGYVRAVRAEERAAQEKLEREQMERAEAERNDKEKAKLLEEVRATAALNKDLEERIQKTLSGPTQPDPQAATSPSTNPASQPVLANVAQGGSPIPKPASPTPAATTSTPTPASTSAPDATASTPTGAPVPATSKADAKGPVTKPDDEF
ncbi:serine/threonine-protein kinase [Polyangium jinanense]|uniref:mitogen-activated protein kinase kinase n=1 Tax=Polyangium jinanense TaxID=2829994 RepID=A0A9X3XEF4_9BACT|nr:protein kinase [Polyangium jinanense]MDC3957020.1 protein kinase [Polyangium jinanense]MDC3986506.1 protein kinase [Polyangium jinanense]